MWNKRNNKYYFVWNNIFTVEESASPKYGLAAIVIAGTKDSSFLTPDMASKNDAKHGIGLSYH